MRNLEKMLVVVLLLVALLIPACAQKESKTGEGKAPASASTASTAAANAAAVKTPSGLEYVDLVPGTGPSPTPGKGVKVHYTGWLTNGKKFDSSLDRNEPFVFMIGAGQVIPGWDEGVLTMKVGGKRKLIVPSQLGYGARGAGSDIPPNATLVFEVELLDVEK